MASISDKKYPAWHVYMVLGLALLSVLWSVINWNHIVAVQSGIHDIAYYGLWIVMFEVCFVTGALLMSIAIGTELPKYHPLHWVRHLRQLRRDIKQIARQSISSRLFGVGFWVNFIGAVGTTSIVIIGIMRHLPFQSWGIIVILVIDLVATFSWRVPLQLLRRKQPK